MQLLEYIVYFKLRESGVHGKASHLTENSPITGSEICHKRSRTRNSEQVRIYNSSVMLSHTGGTPRILFDTFRSNKSEKLIILVAQLKPIFNIYLRSHGLFVGGYALLSHSTSQNCCSSGRQAKLPGVVRKLKTEPRFLAGYQ